jgi:hypothetical protein
MEGIKMTADGRKEFEELYQVEKDMIGHMAYIGKCNLTHISDKFMCTYKTVKQCLERYVKQVESETLDSGKPELRWVAIGSSAGYWKVK